MSDGTVTWSDRTATWEGKAVSLGEIEGELQRLWRAADTHWQGDGRRPDIRTSVLNLIVYAHNRGCVERATAAIRHLSGTHPSRALIIEPGDARGEPSIDAELSIISQGSYAEFGQVCSEEMVLKVNGPSSHHLTSVIIPLLAPDLPVFVWWPGETPFHHHIYAQLRELADRFVVDSSDFAKPADDIVGLAHAAHFADRCAFSDFNWARLGPWREAIAAFFDPPEARACADRLRHLEIDIPAERSPNGLDLPRALLLTGWLASTLGFAPAKRDDEAGQYAWQLAGGSSQLLVRVNVGAPATKLTLQAPAGPGAGGATFALSVDEDTHLTATSALNSSQPAVRNSLLPEHEEGALLFQELELFRHDTAFESALVTASRLLDPRPQSSQARGSLLA
ncbi:MAG TPA: glucose-6-phosphate dehydrogenase assembly protein OpcA [Chloroflexota bacterium]|nr:glucose-6-phosphate dehydrogenase assembly protein OpcA [Chloroflexota bacterium]